MGSCFKGKRRKSCKQILPVVLCCDVLFIYHHISGSDVLCKDSILIDLCQNLRCAYRNYQSVFTQVVNKHLSDKDKEFGIVIVELVHFKQVNNIFGYKTGDEILIEITKRLHSVIGYNDQICRLGAEFFIFLDNIKSAVDVEKICSDIKSEMGTTVYANNYAVKQTVILGYSNSIEDGRDLKVLLHRANEVLDTNHDKYYKNSEDEL